MNLGNVGIGTDDPFTTLDVNGVIKTRGTDFIMWNSSRGGTSVSSGHGRALVHIGTGSESGSSLFINYSDFKRHCSCIKIEIDLAGDDGITGDAPFAVTEQHPVIGSFPTGVHMGRYHSSGWAFWPYLLIKMMGHGLILEIVL